MEIAHIVPVPLLSKYAYGHYHLILAHLCDGAYADFYRGLGQREDYTVILDNGMYEQGTSLNVEQLREIAEDIRPSVIILPDVKDDMKATMKQIASAYRVLRSPFWQLMGVAHGKNLIELEMSFYELMDDDRIDWIGIPRRCPVNRAGFLQRLNQYHKQKASKRKIVKPVHLLGCNLPIYEELLTASIMPWIKGIDTSKIIRYGLSGVILHPEKGTEITLPRSRYFQQEEIPFPGIVEYNAMTARYWSKGMNGVSWETTWKKAKEVKK